jgi:hypothetical protein
VTSSQSSASAMPPTSQAEIRKPAASRFGPSTSRHHDQLRRAGRYCQDLLIGERRADWCGRLVNTGPPVGVSTGSREVSRRVVRVSQLGGRWDCSWFEPARSLTGRSFTLSHYSPIAREDTYLSQGRTRCGRDGRPAFWPAPQSAVKGHMVIRARVAVVGASSLASQSTALSRLAMVSCVP